MNLKQNIRLHRYGERNIQVPDRETTKEYMQPRDRLRKVVGDLDSKVMGQFFHPPFRDKFYLHYIATPNLFHDYVHKMSIRGKQSVYANLINHELCGKLIYMLDHPAQFGEFPDFKYAWLSNALFSMRKTVIKQMYLDKDSCLTTTKAYSINALIEVPYPKSMGHRAMSLLADNLFDILYDRTIYIRSQGMYLDNVDNFTVF